MAPGFPFGVRFRPTEAETMDFLLYKVAGDPPPPPGCIREADLYGDKEPWQIFDSDYSEKLYFFTKLKKLGGKTPPKSGEHRRLTSRNVGGGSWLHNGKPIPVIGKRSRVSGHKRCFRYVRKKEGGNQDFKGTWFMTEYFLPDDLPVKEEYKDCVLAVLKVKLSGKEMGGGTGLKIQG